MGEQLVTAGFTAFFGVIVFVIGQFFQKFLLEPIQNQRRVIGEIAFNLVYLGNVGPNPWDTPELQKINEQKIREAVDTTRSLGAQLRMTVYTIPLYSFWAFLHLVPKKNRVIKASANLVGWSNSIWRREYEVHLKEIRDALDLPH